jgi:dihydrolipoamide dehydrogenase
MSESVSTTDVDVVVIGGGSAGHAAALAAARRKASVVVVETHLVGGNCVHHTCIPSGSMLSAVGPFLETQELGVAGVFDVGQDLRLGRAGARRDALVARLAGGVKASFDNAGIRVLTGTARFAGPHDVEVRLAAGAIEQLHARAVVIATGSDWEPPRLDGVSPAKLVTLDSVVALGAAPASAVVLSGGPARTAFSVESAFLLAAAGCVVTFVAPGGRTVPALDEEVDQLVRASLDGLGVTVLGSADTDRVRAALAGSAIVVAPDGRAPRTAGLGLSGVGIKLDEAGAVVVDAQMRTSLEHVYAAGDVTGGAMVTQVAAHGGRAAGINATGGAASVRLDVVPHVLHTVSPIAWVGLSAAEAGAAGYDVDVAMVDLGWSARGITLGGREGVLTLVVDREFGQVLGASAVGPEAGEIIAVAALAVTSELTVDDLASSVQWHPSAAENLTDAARQLVGS